MIVTRGTDPIPSSPAAKRSHVILPSVSYGAGAPESSATLSCSGSLGSGIWESEFRAVTPLKLWSAI